MSQGAHKHHESCCEDGAAGRALRLPDALARMLQHIQPVQGSETLALREALDRVLDEDVRSTMDVPSHTNSAMDGYALSAGSLRAEGDSTLDVVGTAWAGRPFGGTVGAGQCVRIMTGAPMPAGTDTVVMQEHVVRQGDTVQLQPGHRVGQNVRPAGEDIARGDIALRAGEILQPAQLGVLASLGVGEVRVRRRPRVAFFSTGDELRGIGQSLQDGQIYDSNRYTLYGVLTRLGVEVLDLGVVADDPAVLESVLADAASRADAIVTSGGVSVGDADFVTQVLGKIGQVNFWKVAMKPGKPIAFGRVGKACFFGLPGNPVSVMTTFYALVQPAIEHLKGGSAPQLGITVTALCQTNLKKRPGRREFQRGVLEKGADGRYVVRTTGYQGAGVLRSMAEANCFIVLDEDRDGVKAGDEVQVQPFRGLV